LTCNNYFKLNYIFPDWRAHRLSTIIIAPPLGFAIDPAQNHGIGASEFWPMGVLGALIALGFFLIVMQYTELYQQQ
jgi:hypothetical protein